MPASEGGRSAACSFLGTGNRTEDCAIELRFRSQPGRDNVWLPGQFLCSSSPHWRNKVISGFRCAAAKNDERWIEQGGNGDHGYRHVIDDLLRYLYQLRMFRAGRNGLGGANLFARGFLYLGAQGASADQRSQIPLTSALLSQELTTHHQIANFACCMMGTTVKMAVDHDPGANAGSERQEDEVALAPGRSPPLLAECRGVGILFNANGDGKMLLEALSEAEVDPTGQVAGFDDFAGFGVHQSRHCDADANQIFLGAARACDQRQDFLGQPTDKFVRANLCGRGHGIFGKNPLVFAIPDHECSLGTPDINSDHDAITPSVP